MGLAFGLEKGIYCKRNFRWMFVMRPISGDETGEAMGTPTLPPSKSARPSMTFKEMEVKHLNEDVYYPAKPEWKPITVVLYDLNVEPYAYTTNPVFNWLINIYDPQFGDFVSPMENRYITEASLSMYDGCGNEIEKWIYEDAWVQAVNFGNLDMADTGVATCELTIRYARAYVFRNIY